MHFVTALSCFTAAIAATALPGLQISIDIKEEPAANTDDVYTLDFPFTIWASGGPGQQFPLTAEELEFGRRLTRGGGVPLNFTMTDGIVRTADGSDDYDGLIIGYCPEPFFPPQLALIRPYGKVLGMRAQPTGGIDLSLQTQIGLFQPSLHCWRIASLSIPKTADSDADREPKARCPVL